MTNWTALSRPTKTYIDGKYHGKRGRIATGKTTVLGAVEREGNVVAKAVPNVR